MKYKTFDMAKIFSIAITGKNVKFPCPVNVQYRAEFPVL